MLEVIKERERVILINLFIPQRVFIVEKSYFKVMDPIDTH